MSGAGRGTPRVSPTTNALPVRPGGGSPYGLITELSNAKFRFRAVELTSQLLTDQFEPFTWVNTSGNDFINIPAGLSRAELECRYTEGSPTGRMQLRVRGAGNSIQAYPSTQANSGNLAVTDMRELVYDFSFTGEIVRLPFIPTFSTTIAVEVREVGDIANPGTIEVVALTADNISSISILPNISV